MVLAEERIGTDVLIYDIESKTFGKPDPNKDIMRIFGCYSYKTNKYYLLTSLEDIQKIIDSHKFLVGFNTEEYDEPVMRRAGVNLEYKIRIDLFKIFKQRAGGMKIKQGMLKDLLMSYSLDYITKILGLVDEEHGKQKIDYQLFNKNSWTKEELKIIKDYTIRDIEITKKLYEWVEDYFESFRDFLNEEDVRKKRYITDTIAKFAYKAICKEMNWTEEYNKDIFGNSDDEEGIKGGYVGYPAGEDFHSEDGMIYAIDFASLYPHIMIQCNLYGRKKIEDINDRPVWSGGNVWEVEGKYYSDELSGVSKLLRKWYYNRLFYKRNFFCIDDKKVYEMKDISKHKGKKIYAVHTGHTDVVEEIVDDKIIEEYENLYKLGDDKREYSIKIIINTVYGLLNHAYYKRVYDMIAGGDCTRVGRQFVKYARKYLRDLGYKILYSDTDSVYFQDLFNDKEKMLKSKKEIIDYLKKTTPFPQDTFNLELEAEIKHMFFFKGGGSDDEDEMDEDDIINKPKGLMKKNYIYVSTDGKITIKNLGIRKKSNSPLSRKIFWEFLLPKIKEGQVKFSKSYFKNLIMDLLRKDISLAQLRKDVGPLSDYKKSPTGLQAQVSQKYGSGIHFLLPNTKGIGVGKGKSYCTLEEFNQHNLKLEHIDLSNVYKELEYFTKQAVTVNIFNFVEEQKK